MSLLRELKAIGSSRPFPPVTIKSLSLIHLHRSAPTRSLRGCPSGHPSSIQPVELLCQPLVEHLLLPQSFLGNLPCLLLTPMGYRPAGSYSISSPREPRKHWLCGTLHSAAPTILRVPLLPGIPGSRVNYERSCHVVRGGGLASPAAGPPRAPLLRHKLKLTAKTAIKPQVCLELFSVLLDAPGFNYGLKSPNTSARICLPSPRGGASPAMVAPLLWQSH